MEWCEDQGVRVMSLQHDGVMVAQWSSALGLSEEGVAEQLSMAASRACGYEVVVTATPVGTPPPVVD